MQILDEIGSQFAVAGSVFFFDPDGAAGEAGFEGIHMDGGFACVSTWSGTEGDGFTIFIKIYKLL